MKRIGIMLLQLFVTAAGLWYVFHDPQRRAQIAEALRQASLSWVLVGWVCYSVVEVLATVRWQILLRIQGIRISWLRAGAIVIIGLFFNQFLPGGVGGDAMRLYFIFKQAPRRKVGAALSVAMDRLFGLLTVAFLASVSFCLRFRWLTRTSLFSQIAFCPSCLTKIRVYLCPHRLEGSPCATLFFMNCLVISRMCRQHLLLLPLRWVLPSKLAGDLSVRP